MIQKILKVGSSAAVTIPKKALQELGLKVGDEVRVDVHPNEVVIKASIIEVDKDTIEWTKKFVKRYRKAFDDLADK